MNKVKILRITAMAFGCALFIVSCEKPYDETELPDYDNKEEGFKSLTGNSDSVNRDIFEVSSPILHKHYDASLSREEVDAKFNKEVEGYIQKNNLTARSTEWYYQIETYTGTGSSNGTNGNVWARVNFLTDQGHRHLAYVELDRFWINDRKGGWDRYLFRSSIQNPSIDWVEIEQATLALQGTDGWYVEFFAVRVQNNYQRAPATGNSIMFSEPEIWLDNSTSGGWDYYYTGYFGGTATGRMNF